jgi:hypothetical protein
MIKQPKKGLRMTEMTKAFFSKRQKCFVTNFNVVDAYKSFMSELTLNIYRFIFNYNKQFKCTQ